LRLRDEIQIIVRSRNYNNLAAAILGAIAEEKLKGPSSRTNYNNKNKDQEIRINRGKGDTQQCNAKNAERWVISDEIAALADMQIDLLCRKQKNRQM